MENVVKVAANPRPPYPCQVAYTPPAKHRPDHRPSTASGASWRVVDKQFGVRELAPVLGFLPHAKILSMERPKSRQPAAALQAKIVAHQHGRPNSARQLGSPAGKDRPSRVHRLDARTRLRSDVSSPLLQLLPAPRRKKIRFICLVANCWAVSSPAFHFPCGEFLRFGNVTIRA